LVYNCKFTIIFSNCHHFLSFFWIILLKLAGFKYRQSPKSSTAARPKDQEAHSSNAQKAKKTQQHALKGQKPTAERPKNQEAHSSNAQKAKKTQQHALKGQKLLAQGNALGIRQSAMRPVRAKALKHT
jgi:hypothetical protein